MKPSNVVIALIFAAVTLGLWAVLNRPVAEARWPARVQGFAFSPFHEGQDPTRGDQPTVQQIDGDLALLAGKANAVRTYSTLGTLGAVPRLADRHDLNVAVGAWINENEPANVQEIAGAITLANAHKNVVRVLIGNEAILRGDRSADQLISYLDRARVAIGQPVSTAEPWHIWLKYPELADHVDYLAVHLLPYWEGVSVDNAVDFSFARLADLQARFPDKPIVITEVGWPSNGRTREAAVASPANEALFLRRFLTRAEREGYIYYVMEAFDQAWKAGDERGVGAYWGVYDLHRQPKFEFAAPIERVPEWEMLAAISVGLSVFVLFLLYLDSKALRNRGRSFLAVIAYASTTLMVWVFYDYTQQYLTATSVAVGILLFLGMIGVVLVLLAEAHEWAEARWFTTRRRVIAPAGRDAATLPKVSIHVPAYNEPPNMLIETLDALARLDYPDFEVLVIDNNTPDESTWRPVEAHCAALGPRFRFFHVAPLSGFKAGALNFGLRHTADDATVVAVIDSDYVVEPGWLRDLAPEFDDPQTAIVQAPQDYRDAGQSAFKAMAYAEYRGFFRIGMVTRNERNAIIQHGTMTMVRRTVLENVGGWDESCITEDAELGLRIFAASHTAGYTPRSYGQGLMPDTFIDFKKQRFRWAYGAMQIMKAHARTLFSGEGDAGRLARGQRYHFVAGWLPWLADGFNLVFNAAALAWTAAMLTWPTRIDPPLMMFAVLPLSLFTFKVVKMVHLYRGHVGAGWRQTFAAGIAGLALAHTIGLAVLKGLVTRNEPFFRTPKVADKAALWAAFASARTEFTLAVLLLGAAVAVGTAPLTGGPDLTAWIVMLAVQSLPYLCAVVVALLAALPVPARLVGTEYREHAPSMEPEFRDPVRTLRDPHRI